MGLMSEETWIDRYMRSEARKYFLGHCFGSANAHSILALDPDGEIVAIKLGFKLTTKCKPHKLSYMPWLEHLYWLLPQKIVDMNILSYYFEATDFRFHPNMAMEDLGVDSLFEGAMLCVGKKAR